MLDIRQYDACARHVTRTQYTTHAYCILYLLLLAHKAAETEEFKGPLLLYVAGAVAGILLQSAV